MELEDLKSLWKKHDPGFQQKDEAEIAAMLKGSSKTIVSKLKRSVWFELIFTLVAGLVLLVYALTLPSGVLKWTSIAILLVFVAYSIYYIKKLRLLNHFDSSSDNILSNLEQLVSSLTSYLLFYKRSYTILYPVYFVLGLVFGAIERGTTDIGEVITQPKTLAFLIAVALIFYFLTQWIVNWLLKKLYGNHLDKLKKLLNDLHEKNPA